MSAGQGWIGDPEHVLHVLRTVGADRDDKGNFLVFGEAPINGIDGDVVVPAGTEYSVGGKCQNLAALLRDTSYGSSVSVTVIS